MVGLGRGWGGEGRERHRAVYIRRAVIKSLQMFFLHLQIRKCTGAEKYTEQAGGQRHLLQL